MVKICATSDTHTLHRKILVPECDLFIHAGDITDKGELTTIWDFMSWLREIPAKHKVFIAGNHDKCFQKDRGLVGSNGIDGIYYLENQGVCLQGISIFGSPWTPYFYDWAFNGTDQEEGDTSYGPNLDRLYGQIPDGLDILICHGPMEGVLDFSGDLNRVGSKMLKKHVVRAKPNILICGHVHSGYGYERYGETDCYNVSGLQRDYITPNPITIIDYEPR